jgi:hypothetical protein
MVYHGLSAWPSLLGRIIGIWGYLVQERRMDGLIINAPVIRPLYRTSTLESGSRREWGTRIDYLTGKLERLVLAHGREDWQTAVGVSRRVAPRRPGVFSIVPHPPVQTMPHRTTPQAFIHHRNGTETQLEDDFSLA